MDEKADLHCMLNWKEKAKQQVMVMKCWFSNFTFLQLCWNDSFAKKTGLEMKV